MLNNLIYFLVVILIISTSSTTELPLLPWTIGLTLFAFKLWIYYRWVSKAFSRQRIQTSSHYFGAEQKMLALGVTLLAIDVYLLDLPYYLHRLPGSSQFPSLVNTAGLAMFFVYLMLMWHGARPRYSTLFGKQYTIAAFLRTNVKINLPIILPWLCISFLVDLIQQIPLPWLKTKPSYEWGEPLVLLLFFIVLAVTFPALIKRLWGCRSLPPGPVRRHLDQFCDQQKFFFTDIMSWPLYEGRMLTAAIMGLSKRCRYLLITPALLEALTPEELEAVVAHEIGHGKKYHLQLYIVLILGFGLLLGFLSNPMFYLLLNSELFYSIASFSNKDPGTALVFWGTVPLVICMIVYFRFVFAYFMRNFERQADLHVFKALGDCRPLIQSFEKIAWLSKTGKDKPSWHHFSIGQRIDFLEKCRKNRRWIRWQDRKVYCSLILYLTVLVGSAMMVWTKPLDLKDARLENRFIVAVLQHKIRQEPKKMLWHRLLGDVRQETKQYPEALAAYENAIALEPAEPDLLNNVAWLLLTAADDEIRDPARALAMALTAAAFKPKGYILDTLAAAYWANNINDQAMATEQRAIAVDPANRAYYQQQMHTFTTQRWAELPYPTESEHRP